MIKHIIREVPPEDCDFSFYFDDDGLTEAGGDYFNNLFIITPRGYGDFNGEEYRRVQGKADAVIDGFSDVADKWTNGYNSYSTYKECMKDNDIIYDSHKCHLLKEWAKDADTYDTNSIAKFLTITTGKRWEVDSVRGYRQGDYVEMVYCPEKYKHGVQNYGEIWLGAAKEFCVIDVDENGNEIDACVGFIVADCEAWKDEDYKRLVCEYNGISEEETQLEMIENQHTYTKYDYRIA